LLITFLIQVIITFNSLSFNEYLHDLDCTGVFLLCTDADKDRLGRQAVKSIHEQMDDDKDGMIEAAESNDVRIPLRKFIFTKKYFF
jgi:hypothetical protein